MSRGDEEAEDADEDEDVVLASLAVVEPAAEPAASVDDGKATVITRVHGSAS
jgi:hypothetical protein